MTYESILHRRRRARPSRAFAALCTVIGMLLCATTSASEPRTFAQRDVPDFGVMNNDDGDWLFVSPDADVSRRAMLRAIDELIGTNIKTHVQCVALGSDVMYYPTSVASVVGWQPDRQNHPHVKNTRLGMAAGIDPIRVVGERAKQRGLMFIPSYRLNDAHFAREPIGHYATGKFWMDNRERYALPNNRLDFSHEPVRAFRMAIINEVIDRYGDIMDGIELDFTRHGMFFPQKEAAQNAPLLTAMVESVRVRLEELEKSNGRPCYLVVRVWGTLDYNSEFGIDVKTWIKHRLADVIVPAELYSTSFDMPIGELVEPARYAGIKVYPCLYERTTYNWPMVRKPTAEQYRGAPTHRPSPAMLAGAAATYWSLGADGFEMYNFRAPLGELGMETQQLLGGAAALNGRDRVYVLTPAEGSRAQLKKFQGRTSIPARLSTGQAIDLSLTVGGLESSPDLAAPAHVALRLGIIGARQPSLPIRVAINGVEIHTGPVGKALLATHAPAGPRPGFGTPPEAYIQLPLADAGLVKPGANIVTVESSNGEVTIVTLELGVFFDDPFPGRI